MMRPLMLFRARGMGSIFQKAANLTRHLVHTAGTAINLGIVGASNPAIFYAATYVRETYESIVQLVGIGTPQTLHAVPMYAPDYLGVMQKFPANFPVWNGARVVLAGGPGTDVVEVYADDGSGVPLDPQPYLVAEGFSDEAQTIPATSVNTFDQANHSNSLGPYYGEIDWAGDDVEILKAGNAFLVIEDDGGSGKQLSLTDQTNKVSLPMPAALGDDFMDQSDILNENGSIVELIPGGWHAYSDGTGGGPGVSVPLIEFTDVIDGVTYLLSITPTSSSGSTLLSVYVGGEYVSQSIPFDEPYELEFVADNTSNWVGYDGRDTFDVVVDATIKEVVGSGAGKHSFGVFMEQGKESSVWNLTGTQYAELSTPVEFAGDCEIEFIFKTSSTENAFILGGGDGNINSGGIFLKLSTDEIQLLSIAAGSTNSVLIENVPEISDGAEHTLLWKQEGSTTTVSLDGVIKSSSDAAGNRIVGNIWTILGIRAEALTFPYSGILSSVKFTDSVTPANNQTFIFDSGNTDYQFAEEGGPGNELLVNGDLNTGDLTGWDTSNVPPVTIEVTPDNHLLMSRNNGDVPAVTQAAFLPIGSTVLIESNILIPNSANNLYLGFGNYFPYENVDVITAAGVKANIGTVVNESGLSVLSSGGLTSVLEIDYISVKQLNKAAVFQNVVAGDWTQGDGKMELMLDGTYSPEAPYNNAFGNGSLIVGEDIRELKRWAEATIADQKQILNDSPQPVVVLSENNQQVYDENGDPVYD